jgi:hypothetical protein
LEITKRHHYIPQFFIKEFTGEDGKLAVYNKENGKIDRIRKSPKQIFFEMHRNTFNINGEDSDFVEKLYGLGETKFSETYRKIIGSQENFKFNAFEKLHLMYFISQLHWRVPNQDIQFLENLNKLIPENSMLQIRDKNSGKSVTPKLFSELINNPPISEAFKMIKAIEDFEEITKEVIIENWKLYSVGTNLPQLNLLSDNPAIIRNPNSNILKSELIFSLTKGITVYHTNGKSLNEIPAENRIRVDILAFLQSNKFVCGPKSEYLKDIAEYAKFYDTANKIEKLKENVFDIFK